MQRIVVINPNSLQAVTDGLAVALARFRVPGGPEIACQTLKNGPPGIETQAHVDGVTEKLLAHVADNAEARAADVLVIACFSDPGVHALREVVRVPVLGIAESSYLSAAALGERIGVIAILARSIPRHRRQQRLLGLHERIAAEQPLELGVAELANEERTWSRLVTLGTRLREEHAAQSVILGCAGMARYRERLEDTLGVPVIDPTQAAVGIALGLLLARQVATSKRIAA